MGYTKALFLVDDEKTESLEADVARQQFVRPYDNVHGPVGEAVSHRSRLGRG